VVLGGICWLLAVHLGWNFRLTYLIAIVLAWVAATVWYARVPDWRFSALAHGNTTIACDRASTLTIGKAILIGELVVNIPALALLLASLVGFGSWMEDSLPFLAPGHHDKSWQGRLIEFGLVLCLFTVATAIGWLWWSLALPRWRLWALRRVNDPFALRGAAIGASLMYPSKGWGRLFARTEIQSRADREEEQAIIAAFVARQQLR
jgi:hypothetical protein